MKKPILKLPLIIAMIYLGNISLSFADHSTKHNLEKRPIVDEIEIRGLWRTKPKVVLRELFFRENDVLTTKDLLASVQRLKNLRIFSKVHPLLELKPENKVKVIFLLQEKWTIIPYANVSGGGGTTYAKAGVFDINSFGRYIETGVQYDNWNGRHGGIARIRDPRFLDQRLVFGVDLWATQRVRQLYATNSKLQGNYVLETKKIEFILKKEITAKLHIGTELEFNKSSILENNANTSLENQSDTVIDSDTLQLVNNNNKGTATFSKLFIEIGKFDFDNYILDGKFTKFSIKHSNKLLGSNQSTTQLDMINLAFWKLPYHANAGFRFNAGWTNTKEIQDLYYIGGFQDIRGYFDGQFRSKTFWQFNAEYRIPSYRSNWLVLQHVFFIDVVGTGNRLDDLKDNGIQFSSAGTGIRIISPRIYSFNGRLDIAIFTSGNSPTSISFGTQQYF